MRAGVSPIAEEIYLSSVDAVRSQMQNQTTTPPVLFQFSSFDRRNFKLAWLAIAFEI
jgi:hypothetical protein